MNRPVFLTLTALATLMLCGLWSCAATKPAALTPEQQAQHAAQQQADSLAFMAATSCLESMNFIIIPSSIQINGQRTHFSPNEMTNFVCAADGKGVVQLASARNPSPGANGMGGFTAEGKIKLTRQHTGKKGDRTFEYGIMGRASATITVNVPHNSSRASVRITSNTYPGSINMDGKVVPYDPTRVSVGAPRR